MKENRVFPEGEFLHWDHRELYKMLNIWMMKSMNKDLYKQLMAFELNYSNELINVLID